MRVFVTGACGFLGRFLLPALLENDDRVTALASAGGLPDSALCLDGIDWLTGDARDFKTLLSAVQGHDAVIHLAGRYPRFGIDRDPMSYVESNTLTTSTVLEACRRNNVSQFVFPSTAGVYGKPDRVPIAESDPLNGATVYAASKIAAESIAGAYAAEFGVNTVSLRVFNVYGPGQHSTNVVGTIVEQAVRPGPVTLYSATPERDFVYVGDVARALVAAIHANGLKGKAINIASGCGVQIGALARRVMDLCGRTDQVAFKVPEQPGTALDPDCVIGDVRLAEQRLGWRPTTSLEEGLIRAIEWTRKGA
jgi:UDP-glucose 4-epimerase